MRLIQQQDKTVQQQMKFQTFESLVEDLPKHKQYEHQIKQKRLKKQLSILSEYDNPNVQFVNFQICPIGIILHLNHIHHNKKYPYNFVLDFQYPFNRPQIHYVHETHNLAQCKDLIDILLQGTNWGPSIMLTEFLDKLSKISVNSILTLVNDIIQRRIGQMDLSNQLRILQLIFATNENRFVLNRLKYLELHDKIHPQKLRILGVSNQVLFKFQLLRNNNLRLISWKRISQIKQAKGSVGRKSFTLQIIDKQNNKQYFAGKQVKDVQSILAYLNPIEMIERRLDKYQELLKAKQIDETHLVKQLSQLIQFYSVSNPEKAQNYVNLMKTILQNKYNHLQQKQQKKEKQEKNKYKEDIKQISQNKKEPYQLSEKQYVKDHQKQQVENIQIEIVNMQIQIKERS